MNGRENYMRGKSTSYLVDNLSFLKYSYISFYFLLHYVIELFPTQMSLVKSEQEPAQSYRFEGGNRKIFEVTNWKNTKYKPCKYVQKLRYTF